MASGPTGGDREAGGDAGPVGSDSRPFSSRIIWALSMRLIRWMSWVATTTVVPRRLSASNKPSRRIAISGSTLPVGSSATSSCGRAMTARAIATRCCSPPDSVGGKACARSLSPIQLSISPTGPDRSSSLTPAMRSGSAILSRALKWGISRKSWNTTPMRRRKPGRRWRGIVPRSSPNSRTIPRLGRCAR